MVAISEALPLEATVVLGFNHEFPKAVMQMSIKFPWNRRIRGKVIVSLTICNSVVVRHIRFD